MKAVCVFCGSNVGRNPAYHEAAVAVGTALAKAGLKLVYGGGKIGLMGAVADAIIAAGGLAAGVMPRALFQREIAHAGLSELHVVETMHQRKTKMAELADGFIALPGGAGTLEEFFEQWTWAQLGIHRKPCGLLNVQDYFSPLIAMMQKTVTEGFTGERYFEMLVIETSIEPMLQRFATYSPPPQKSHAPKP
ncbi:TIGR00730 family Rossman fold protein [Bradyrhizobium sp. Tv2a-2]|uniref:LOG family protein n=1 Tax=Bradyrhizobium sp. Tv2a-2 TaxID=113395 RepID=UPI000427CA88|nr:TIGR00730 family Rossman fold protein [Bradyrhizobium sp. Tv2a-2]